MSRLDPYCEDTIVCGDGFEAPRCRSLEAISARARDVEEGEVRGMITVKYPDGRVKQCEYVIASGDPPIGNARPLPDGATLNVLDGCVEVIAGEDSSEQGSLIWPWDKITELRLGPLVQEKVTLMEVDEQDIPF